jgi:hypothetical protein
MISCLHHQLHFDFFTGFKVFLWYLFQVWARIWSVLANHFISAGSHHDEKIAMYAIDSLRQLGMKYLERAELANFTFQNDILKPFVVLMRNSRSQSIRRLIVDCIVQVCALSFPGVFFFFEIILHLENCYKLSHLPFRINYLVSVADDQI